MGRLIVEIVSAAGLKRDLRVFDKTHVRIGRGYDNDIILQDPYVDAAQCCISLTENGVLFIEDSAKANALYFSAQGEGKKCQIDGCSDIPSGATLYIGQAVLRVFLPDHPVAPVKYLGNVKEKGKRNLFKHVPETWYSFIGLFLVMVVEGLQRNPDMENHIGMILFVSVVLLIFLSLWAGIWALFGRLLRNRANLRVHITIVSFYALLACIFTNVSAYAGAIFMSPLVHKIISAILMGGVTAFLLYAHLTYATRLRWRARVLSALAVPLIFFMLGIMGQWVYRNQFLPYPPYYSGLKPPIIKPVKVYSIDEYIERKGKVFENARRNK